MQIMLSIRNNVPELFYSQIETTGTRNRKLNKYTLDNGDSQQAVHHVFKLHLIL